MNFHNSNLPALPIRLPEIVDEHNRKADAATETLTNLKRAIGDFMSNVTVQGMFAESVFSPNLPGEREMQKNLRVSAWKHVYQKLDIDKIASVKDKARFERLFADPPAFTIPMIRQELGDYLMNPRFHILRGLAEAFTSLDPAYKSHSKVKIGVAGLPKRVIISGMNGYSTCHARNMFRDMMNALATYQGKPLFEHLETYLIDQAFATGQDVSFNGQPVVSRSRYDNGKILFEPPARGVTIRPYKNGNAHVIFDNDTLRDINRALAEFYGEVLPDAEGDEPKAKQPGTAVSKDLQYYPTPKKVVDEVLSAVGIYTQEQMGWRREDMPVYRVLEPSCGCGRFMDAIKARGHRPLGMEYDAGRADIARSKGHPVLTANFLDQAPSPEFDFVVMNPPFYGRHYVKHVRHALKFLKPGGKLVAVLPATAHYDHEEIKGQWYDLPVASFAESGTNVPTGYVIINAPRSAA